MEYICPACGGPNEEPFNTKLITCAWCGKSFRILPASTLAQAPAQTTGRIPEQISVHTPGQTPVPPNNPEGPVSQQTQGSSATAGKAAAPVVPAFPDPASDNAFSAVAAAAKSATASAEIVKAAQSPDLAEDPAKVAEIAAAAARAAEEAMAAARAAASAAALARQNALAGMTVADQAAQPSSAPLEQRVVSEESGSPRTSTSAKSFSSTASPVPAPASSGSDPAVASSGPTPASTSSGANPVTMSRSSSGPGPASAASAPAPAPARAAAGPERRYVRKKFADAKTGIVLATSAVPESFSVSGSLVQKWQSDLVPFTASIRAVSPDNRVLFSSSSGEFFTYYLNPLVRSMAAKVPNAILSQLRDFIEPDEYLHQYARSMAGVPLTPTARAALPSPFGRNLQEERNRLIQYTKSHAINISVQIAYSTFYCDAFLYRYEAVVKGRKTVILAGCDYKGVESYDASNALAAISPLAGAAGLFAGGMQGGLLGGLMHNKKAKAGSASAQSGTRSRASSTIVSPTGIGADGIPFGHGKEHGKKVDEIDWGSDRLYFMAAPAEEEKAATAAFLQFIASLVPDPALWKRRSLLIEQMYQQRFAEAAQLNRQATQMQIQAQQRQRDLARQLQQNSEEISRGIMDSWEKQSASHSRMSENWSQAIRGVDTWQTPSGRTVEASVSADHVYQNRYGDTIEVSGTALDDELTSRLDWTELKKGKN